MDPSTRLMQIIKEMRVEINRLEKENHDLRVKLTSISQTATSSGRESGDETEEAACGQCPGTIHGGVPVDSTPAVQEQQGNVMIVRRYAISPSVHSYAANDPWKASNRLSNDGTALAWSSTRKQDNEEKMLAADAYSINSSSQKAPSDHSFVYREKTKTVSFQLPGDGSSVPKNSNSLKHSANQTTNQLSIIAEKDV
ncbi:putative coiled-coil domain-containing protein 195 [Psammomys obesus]|uniref:putative coiled-coil domain-containing protein 195 n=1 Tax=Psammomys obesus TaxID=48139 RepID=UPI00245296F8|nr:putative coiled-coil domain-containing protein 195 [Psammomys obesus]